MNTTNGSLYSARISTGRTTYFIDVRQAVNDRFYISLTESRRIADSDFDQSRIYFFEENLLELSAAFEEAVAKLKDAAISRGELPTDRADGMHERSGKKWTEQEETTVREEFHKETPVEAIADKIRRSCYAVTLRLVKMGLIEKVSEDSGITEEK